MSQRHVLYLGESNDAQERAWARAVEVFPDEAGPPQTTAWFPHLVQRWRDLFRAEFDVLLYDLTSAYFKSEPLLDTSDKRPDCVQAAIAVVVTPQGFQSSSVAVVEEEVGHPREAVDVELRSAVTG